MSRRRTVYIRSGLEDDAHWGWWIAPTLRVARRRQNVAKIMRRTTRRKARR